MAKNEVLRRSSSGMTVTASAVTRENSSEFSMVNDRDLSDGDFPFNNKRGNKRPIHLEDLSNFVILERSEESLYWHIRYSVKNEILRSLRSLQDDKRGRTSGS